MPAAWLRAGSFARIQTFYFQNIIRDLSVQRGHSMTSIVRAFVVTLVLTGAAATTQISSASTQNKVVASRVVASIPVPTCPPDDPNACGMAQGR
jgi:hypothetical protein